MSTKTDFIDFRTFTPEQLDQITTFADKWCNITLSTTPVDRQKAELGVHLLYDSLGIRQPVIKWYDSPKLLYDDFNHLTFYLDNTFIAQENNELQQSLERLNSLARAFFHNFASIPLTIKKILAPYLSSYNRRPCPPASNLGSFDSWHHSLKWTTFEATLLDWKRADKLQQEQYDRLKSKLICARSYRRSSYVSTSCASYCGELGLYVPRQVGIALIDWYLEMTGEAAQHPSLDAMRIIAGNTDLFEPWYVFAFLSERPCSIVIGEHGLLHDDARPAIRYIDDTPAHFWQGEIITAKVSSLLQQPEYITDKDIADCANEPAMRRLLEQCKPQKPHYKIMLMDILAEKDDQRRTANIEIYGIERFIHDCGNARALKYILSENNIELRRKFIEAYGWKQFMLDAEAKTISSDEFGTVYQLRLRGDMTLTMVKVVNSTPNPDGTFKDYFILAHPQGRPMWRDNVTGAVTYGAQQDLTGRNLVAASFGYYGNEYCPEMET